MHAAQLTLAQQRAGAAYGMERELVRVRVHSQNRPAPAAPFLTRRRSALPRSWPHIGRSLVQVLPRQARLNKRQVLLFSVALMPVCLLLACLLTVLSSPWSGCTVGPLRVRCFARDVL